jgi:hypothetical protein
MYSLISPRKKTVLTQDVQLVLTFFAATLVMLFLTYAFLIFKEYRFTQDTMEAKNKQQELNVELDSMKAQITFIEKEALQAEKIYTQNSVLKESINNLFDLVPQRITLSEANLLKNGLILYGITPNKDVYNFMLYAPLRSIFNKTYSSFYPDKNGWLRFVSTNYIDKDDEGLGDEN